MFAEFTGEDSAALNRRLAVYRFIGYRTIEGWFPSGVLSIMSVLDSVQRSHGVSGGVAEIGVYHGRSFTGLNLLRRDGETAVAIDVFGDREHSQDHPYRSSQEIFQRNVRRWSSIEGVEILHADSTNIDPGRLMAVANGALRFFSIDGGHSKSAVLNDMKLAAETLSPGGVVMSDDVFNQAWPGVATATLQYLNDEPDLVPFAISSGMVFFSQRNSAGLYLARLQDIFGNKFSYYVKASEFADHPVLVISRMPYTARNVIRRSRRTARNAISRSETARAVYRRLKARKNPIR